MSQSEDKGYKPPKGFAGFRKDLAEKGRLPAWKAKTERKEKVPVYQWSDRLNVLWLMADQLRADTFGFAGHPSIKTPNIDRLAARGAVFENSFCAAPVCAPSRATFLTGKYLFGHGVLENPAPMRGDCRTLGDYLREAGYRAANIGKTHAGRRGKDIWEYTDHFEDAFGATMPSQVAFEPENYPELTFVANEVCSNPNRVLYGTYPGGEKTTKSYQLARKAIKWLYWHDDPRPFFLRVSFDDPHPPIVPPEPFASMYAPEDVPEDLLDRWKESAAAKPATVQDWREFTHINRISEEDHRIHAARYMGLVSHLDAQIGRLVDYLDELGIADSTMIILNSDHGDMIGEHGLCHKGPYCYEGTIRIPTIFCVPGGRARTCDDLVEGVDFLPTVLDLLGIQRPESLPGRSLAGAIRDGASLDRQYAFIQWEDYVFCIRSKRWKLTWYEADATGELYDLDADPLEKVNLWDDAGAEATRDDLLGRLDAWRETYAAAEDHPYRA
jgi:arylsulfatase A-like enzyme